MAAHRYWRVKDITVGGAAYLELRTLHLFEGRTRRTAGTTYTSSDAHGGGGTLTSRLADDHSENTNAFWSEATAEAASFWIKIDFGSGSAYDIDSFQQGMSSQALGRMAAWTWEYSDDDSAWTSAGSGTADAPVGAGVLGPRTFLSGGYALDYIIPVGFLTRLRNDISKNVDITSTGTLAMAKGFFRAVDVTVNGTLGLLRSYTKILAFGSTTVVDATKQMYKTFSSTHSGSVQLARDYTRIIGITVTGAPLMLRKIAMAFAIAASGAATAAVQKGINVAVAVSSAVTVALQKVGFIQGDPDDTAVVAQRPAHVEMAKRDDKVVF